MFCTNCGKEVEQGAGFCRYCGTKQKAGKPAGFTSKMQMPGGGMNKKPFLILGLIAVLAVVLFAVVGSGGDKEKTLDGGSVKADAKGFGSSEKVIEAYFNAATKRDPEGFIGCFPEEMQADLIQAYNAYRNKGSNLYGQEMYYRFMSLSSKVDFSYEIRETDELEQGIIDNLQSVYGLDIENANSTKVSLTGKYNADGGTYTDSPNMYIETAQIGGKWYLVGTPYADQWQYFDADKIGE